MSQTEIKIDVADYLSQEDIKELCKEQVRYEIQKLFKNEIEAQRLLANLSYEIVFKEVDKVIENSRELVINKTQEIINNPSTYSVFRDGFYGGKKSLAYDIMEKAVKDNTLLINEKVKETILNKDYSKEVWDKFEQLADAFTSNIYEIVRLGRESK